MEFKYFMPTIAYFGADCIEKNSTRLGEFGRKAFIVTGGRSAKASGALSDICDALRGQAIEYIIFDKVENNPSTDTVKRGGEEAREAGADFVVGIGGGSPLDASKAIAVLATNAIEPEELFTNRFRNKPLPIIAVPTTAGTGSEVTPYSILTRRDLQTKTSFGNEDTFPKIAFLDPKYTESLSPEITVNTAIDAFSHCMEGYLVKTSTPVSDILALEGITLFGKYMDKLKGGYLNREDRSNLLYMSMLGGIVISHTGTTIVHGAGYNLTYFKDVPHGRANGYLMAEFLRYNYGYAADRIDQVLQRMKLESIDAFDAAMKMLIGKAPHMEESEIGRYAAITMTQRSTAKNIRPVQETDIAELLRKL